MTSLHFCSRRFARNRGATDWGCAFLQRKVRGKSGNDRLALRDLDALGLPGQEIANTLRPPVSIRLLELLDSDSRRSYPMAVLGYTYCMERLAILYGDEETDE